MYNFDIDYEKKWMELLIILAFLVWLWSLIVLIAVRKKGNVPPEIISPKKRVMGLNIALIGMIGLRIYSVYYFYRGRYQSVLRGTFIGAAVFNLIELAMVVLAVLCTIESVKLFKVRSQARQQVVQQQPQEQVYVQQQPQEQVYVQQQPQEQAYVPQQPQEQVYVQQPPQEQAQFCCHCGMKLPPDSSFCVNCGKKI